MASHKLVLIRHGESNWNQENRFCGWFDADLSATGEKEAKRGGQALKGEQDFILFFNVLSLSCCELTHFDDCVTVAALKHSPLPPLSV